MRPWLLAFALTACGRHEFDVRADTGSIDTLLADDLLAYYKLDDEPADGALDSSGRGHDATCATACPVVQGGKIDGAYRFALEYLEIPDAPDLHPAQGITIALWVFSTYNGNNAQGLAQKRYGTVTANSWQVMISPTRQLRICTTAGPGTDTCVFSASNMILNGAWYHVAQTWNGTHQRGYVNGVMVAEQLTGMVFDEQPILIGADIDNGAPAFHTVGLIDDVRIYNRALDAAELAAIAGL